MIKGIGLIIKKFFCAFFLLVILVAGLVPSWASAAISLTLTPSSVTVNAGQTKSISWRATGTTVGRYTLGSIGDHQSWMRSRFTNGNFSSNTGTITFSPDTRVQGTFFSTFTVCDAGGAKECNTRNFRVEVVSATTPPSPLRLTISNFTTEAGRAFNHAFVISGGRTPYRGVEITNGSFSNGDRPFGDSSAQILRCNNDTSCRVPSSSQTRTFTARVTDADGVTKTDSFTITITAQPVNGMCGSAHGRNFAISDNSYGSYRQCTIGSSSNTAFPVSGGLVNWSCRGENNGTSASCSASRAAPAVTPIVNGLTPLQATLGVETQFCFDGINLRSGMGFHVDDCANKHEVSGTSLGRCWRCTPSFAAGTKNAEIKTAPSGTLLNSFQVTFNGQPTNGQCGTANGKAYTFAQTSYGSDAQCSTGASSNTAFPLIGSTVNWSCTGTNGGSSVACSASREDSLPPEPIVTSVSPANVTLNQLTTFTILGSHLPNTLAFFIPQCEGMTNLSRGSSSQTFRCTPSHTAGTKTAIIKDQPDGTELHRINIEVTAALVLTNGVCGIAHNHTFSATDTSYGVANQCYTGTSSNTTFPALGGTATWVCLGLNGGRNSSQCTANRDNAPSSVTANLSNFSPRQTQRGQVTSYTLVSLSM